MASWWSNWETLAALNNLMLSATLVGAALTGVMAFLSYSRSKTHIDKLAGDVEVSQRNLKLLQNTAEEIRKELLATQQHQDINQLRLKTSKSSADELRQELIDARKRLEVAEAAVQAHEEQRAQNNGREENHDTLELEVEEIGGLSESQREQLIGLLDPGPKGNVDIFCAMDNEDSSLTARHLEEILTADGWKTSGVTQSVFSDPPKGIVLAVNSKETAPSYSSFLQRVFSTIGMRVSAKIDKKYREWSLTIIVGEHC